MLVLRIPSLAMCLVLCSQLSVQGDWLEFRGTDGAGRTSATGLPINWSDTENIAWKTEIQGLAWSSPVVSGDFIYLTNAVPLESDDTENKDHSLRLLCLNKHTGEKVWDNELFIQTGKVEFHKKNSHASPTPIIEGDKLYAHFGPHGTACVNLKGEVQWQTKLAYSPTHGNGGSPALAVDVLIICCDGHDVQYVTGLNKHSGAEIWKTDRDTEPTKGFSFSTPLVIDVNGQQQAVCPGSDAVFAYDPQTGKEIWRVNYPDGYSVTPRPIYGNGLVFVCSGFNKPVLYAIDPAGAGDITESNVRWQLDRAIPHSPSVLLVDENLFVVSDKGIGTCLNALTGVEHWQERLGGNFSASPTYAEGHVYFQDEEGKTIVVAADTTFKELSRNSLADGERTFASYAIDGQAILLRSETALYRIEQK